MTNPSSATYNNCNVHIAAYGRHAPPRVLLSFSYLKKVEDLGDKPRADADARSRASVARGELRTLELYVELKQWHAEHKDLPGANFDLDRYRKIKSVTKFKEQLTTVRSCLVV